jgi:ATP-binding cassette subfamily B protein
MSASELIKPYFIENRLRILIGLACLITVDILQLFIPRIIKQAVDDLTGFQIEGRQLLVYALYMVAIAVCIGIFRYISGRGFEKQALCASSEPVSRLFR